MLYKAAASFTTVSVTFLVELGFSGTDTGIIFLIVLVSTIPGGYIAIYLTKRGNPIMTMKLVLVTFIVVNFVAFILLGRPGLENTVYIWGPLWGIILGWFYPTQSLLFSSLMPKGQESELAGFYLYCGQILSWLPPLVFTIFNESPKIDLSWAGVQLNIYLFIALLLYQFMPSWSECVEIVDMENKIIKYNTEDKEDVFKDDV